MGAQPAEVPPPPPAGAPTPAPAAGVRRELVVILAADVAGYSSLMEEDDEQTLAQLDEARAAIRGVVADFGGRPFGMAGDSVMVEFRSPVSAVRAAIRIQRALAELNAGRPAGRRMELRIGINIGDVLVEGDNLYGDGVNVAARLQERAEPGGLCVSRTVHEQVRNRVDLAFRPMGALQVKNIAAPVEAYRARVDERSGERPPPRRGLAVGAAASMAAVVAVGVALQWGPARDAARPGPPGLGGPAPAERRLPSVLVMPLETLGDEPGLVLLADGLTADLTTDLGRFGALLVFGQETARTYVGRPVRVSEVARELDARYVVEGTIQRSGDRLRCNIRLLEGGSGRQIWAERWDRREGDFLTLQADLAESVVARLPVEVAQAERERLRARHDGDFGAYRLWLEARALFDDPTRENNERARELLTRALERDPGFVRALGHLSYTYVQDYQYGWAEDPEAARARALELALEAVRREPDDYDNQWSLAIARTQTGELEQALRAYARAVELNPNDPKLRAEMGDALVAAGRYDEAVAQVGQAILRDPAGPSWYWWNLGYAHLVAGRAEEAVAAFEARADLPEEAMADAAAAYALRGRPGDAERAAAAMRRYREANPDNTLAEVGDKPFAVQADKERYLDALRRAGLPEA
jgi:adenylate cyclase